ncbi:hypothetical protein DTO027B5_507 [Paecilomyces variotii]|nr:hypothetical protein DTO169C6_3798 [Paecilomyces variotii]KAJ9326748.1 hypothetical protein DTO027B3_2409 [Paecilomyces variotii]KAJ9337686.1 hypothetical protein DTO027B5_507 [Paecilomyces variotii]KAJ9395465.1 hypothetical protein DTO282F9_7618 [Paecilomyces variotii]
MSTSAFPKAGSTPSKTPFSAKKTSTKKNTSILSFFQKTDGPPKATSTQQRITQFGSKIPRNGKSAKNGTRVGTGAGNNLGVWGQDSAGGKDAGGLFFDDKRGRGTRTEENKDNDGAEITRGRSRTPDDDLWEEREDERFNENHAAVKRRRIQEASSLEEESKEDVTAKDITPVSIKAKKNNGPFIDESDSEDDLEAFREVVDVPDESTSKPKSDGELVFGAAAGDISPKDESSDTPPLAAERPPLVREATSHIEDDEFADFDDLEEDEFRGEDFLEGQWTEEQKDLELRGYETPETSGAGETNEDTNNEIPTCPICQASLGGLSHSEVSLHVNNCLDGNPSLVPTAKKTVTKTASMSRAERASITRPAQSDPHAIHASAATSAFSKLMAGNAEDSAWAAAAAHEAASRGKQAYERTCPFYKIITGYSICVDAFRYGAVQGCNAYFLSHFHSDHYVGLTSSWRHGPIYCSRVTANLVRQQLKVDPKWVVDLEFETTTEVPGTEGVRVTMIPANHCPGSSLFLFEKTIGSGPSSRLHRVLHCGDFRACPAHVQHPMLRPEAIDVVTGKTRQQRIDVCYLDTTYLNPKYSFPPQDDVVKACAEICVSLDQNDGDTAMFAKSNNGHAAGGLTKFLSNANASGDATQSSSAGRGRLLVVVGTYSIGKERLCVAIARALKCKIWANPAKQRVCSCLEDPELSALLTDDPLEAQVHMQTIFEIRAETLQEYLASMKPHFSKVVGFRPTGWNYRPPAGRMLDSPPVSAVLHSDNWKTRFSVRNLVPQRGSTKESSCFGVPYSEHSSFRELTMFCCSLRIARIIPTVNVGNRKTREKMKAWFERWEVEKRKTGLFRVEGEDW